MFGIFKVGVSALVLSTCVVAPVATLATVGAAHAKNNGNGKGGEKGNSGKGKANGHSKAKSNGGGNKGGNSNGRQTSANLGKAIRDDFRSLSQSLRKSALGDLLGVTGSRGAQRTATVQRQAPKAQRVSLSPTRSAPERSMRPPLQRTALRETPELAEDYDALHPRNLGKLNGALNSSPQAKAAHIANGTYATGSGPVSLAAALAVADHNLIEAANALETYDAAERTLDLADAFALVENRPTEAERAVALATLEDPEATEAEKLAAQDVLDYPDTTAAEAEIAGLDRPSERDLTEAQEVIDAGIPEEHDLTNAANSVADAETAVLAAYKDILPAEYEGDVLSAVRASNPDDDTVAAALQGTAPLDPDALEEAERYEAERYEDAELYDDETVLLVPSDRYAD
ncbi:hypothetical protein AYJ57_23355 (plasmid) [Salipiger sp. CCB-MM3]|uniref:hypothetical protein n=1 Tax=Salipiger sp. CCB-MM3 TaxID=1792508 RepID=UPI00080A9CBD|nr:hypothetical protein [Salipiger sp. CCB-MM3]ANT63422.1 hypothetical protein AYJ57_23355 [Salipiger sp. CCB-MM3]